MVSYIHRVFRYLLLWESVLERDCSGFSSREDLWLVYEKKIETKTFENWKKVGSKITWNVQKWCPPEAKNLEIWENRRGGSSRGGNPLSGRRPPKKINNDALRNHAFAAQEYWSKVSIIGKSSSDLGFSVQIFFLHNRMIISLNLEQPEWIFLLVLFLYTRVQNPVPNHMMKSVDLSKTRGNTG